MTLLYRQKHPTEHIQKTLLDYCRTSRKKLFDNTVRYKTHFRKKQRYILRNQIKHQSWAPLSSFASTRLSVNVTRQKYVRNSLHSIVGATHSDTCKHLLQNILRLSGQNNTQEILFRLKIKAKHTETNIDLD